MFCSSVLEDAEAVVSERRTEIKIGSYSQCCGVGVAGDRTLNRPQASGGC